MNQTARQRVTLSEKFSRKAERNPSNIFDRNGDKLTREMTVKFDRDRLSDTLRGRRDSVTVQRDTSCAHDAILSAISAAIQTKKDEHRARLRSTGKIYAKRRRHVADCRRSSDRKRPPCIFFVLLHVTGSLAATTTTTTTTTTLARLIENSIILFLSSG